MPQHRTCSQKGCGGPAIWGSLCYTCAHETPPNTNLEELAWPTP